jgi:8-oxo-dGTP diphosphatase
MGNDILTTCDECNGWLNPALAADAAVQRGDTILLIQRKFPPMQGSWALPGGFVERDEDPEVAAIRELFEETGLKGTGPELLMVMGDPKRDPRKHIISVVYSISVSEDQQPIAGDDAQDARFWPLETILSGDVQLAGDHMQIIKKWFNL